MRGVEDGNSQPPGRMALASVPGVPSIHHTRAGSCIIMGCDQRSRVPLPRAICSEIMAQTPSRELDESPPPRATSKPRPPVVNDFSDPIRTPAWTHHATTRKGLPRGLRRTKRQRWGLTGVYPLLVSSGAPGTGNPWNAHAGLWSIPAVALRSIPAAMAHLLTNFPPTVCLVLPRTTTTCVSSTSQPGR